MSTAVRYVGAIDAVEVTDSEGISYVCERDKDVELPDELAAGLLAQDVWSNDAKAAAATTEPKAKPKKGSK